MSIVLLTDYAWPDDAVERRIIEGAGHTLISGPSVAGDASAIEALARQTRPQAIVTCWARVSSAAIAAASNLRLVARMGVGLDNIDVDAATAVGAWVTNVPDYCVEEVSDHALALIFAWTRGIVTFDTDVKNGVWNPAAARLRRLADLSVGILGYGRIGRLTGRKLRGLGLRVRACNTTSTGAQDGVEIVPLDELLRDSDIVIVNLPLTPQTRHFVGARMLAAMKPGAYLVNVSRGPIVDSAALIDALERGHLAGAGLDVVEGEPAPSPDLVGRADVIATPHVAFSSDAAVAELRERAAQEVVRVLAGSRPLYPCNTP